MQNEPMLVMAKVTQLDKKRGTFKVSFLDSDEFLWIGASKFMDFCNAASPEGIKNIIADEQPFLIEVVKDQCSDQIYVVENGEMKNISPNYKILRVVVAETELFKFEIQTEKK